jgi:hypothetical protein
MLEIHEPDGSVSKGEHTSPDEKWYVEGHYFQHEGRMLRVVGLREAGGSFDQILICNTQ